MAIRVAMEALRVPAGWGAFLVLPVQFDYSHLLVSPQRKIDHDCIPNFVGSNPLITSNQTLTRLLPPCVSSATCSLLEETGTQGLENVFEDWRHLVARYTARVCPFQACISSLPAEIGRAVPRRRGEFVIGRLAAYRLFKDAGVTDEEAWITSEGRRPLWPFGYVGSISHTDELVAVAVTKNVAKGRSIGLGRVNNQVIQI